MNTLLMLLIGFEIKHGLADYVFQTTYMQKKSDKGTSWILPLLSHVSVHAALTLLIVLYFKPGMIWLGALDFGIHFLVDRIKGITSRGLTPWGLAFRVAFWIDQLAHFLTNLLIIHLMGFL